jgi:hypothetical protein
MGLHRDGTHLGLSAFETEIRRRVWSQIIFIDSSTSMLSGFGRHVYAQFWDTKNPTNISDANMLQNMTTFEDVEGPTDCLFVICHAEMNRLFVDAPKLDVVLQQHADPEVRAGVLRQAKIYLENVESSISKIMAQYGDISSSPLHVFTIKMFEVMLEKLKEIFPPIDQPNPPPWAHDGFQIKEHLFSMAISMLERAIGIYEASMPSGNFLWFGE